MILNVTDISSYTYCPRKFFLEKVQGLRKPPSKPMIEGKIRHEIREAFSKSEKAFIQALPQLEEPIIIDRFNKLLDNLIDNNFTQNSQLINKFSINKQELKQKIRKSLARDFSLRASSIKQAMEKGFLGQELWQNLSPKYASELFIIAENLNLKGRIDRVQFNTQIIPFELKTRPATRIWPSDEIQLAAYSLLLESKYKQPVNQGILEAGQQVNKIEISSEKKEQVKQLIREIQNMIQEKKMPPHPSRFNKCRKCSFYKECYES
ncbi:MAG: CRISPR-associated protein Cas4 [Candidatus Nanoarchaeia archaeon]